MKLQILFLSLITIGTLHARSVQYAIKNTMDKSTTQVVVSYEYSAYSETQHSGKSDKYAIPLNNPIEPNAVYAWNAENTQEICWDRPLGRDCKNADAYPVKIVVSWKDGQATTDVDKSYDNMYWVILPDGKIQRVYQIYYDGTIFPFLRDDPRTKAPDTLRFGQTFEPKKR